MNPQKFAVFDVDDTLLGFKSLFSFAEFFYRQHRAPQSESFEQWHQHLQTLAKAKGREVANQMFYRLFAGTPMTTLEACLNDWANQFGRGFPVVKSALQALQKHRKAGDRIVFLSGSATLFLQPFLSVIPADDILATELEVFDGRVTGNTKSAANIGQGKKHSLVSFMNQQELRSVDGVGYGDHISDQYFLSCLGKGYVVAGDPQMESLAKQNQWPILSAQTETHFLPNLRKAS